ncbi:uncharacterized protein K452DRAFT_307272 [Aplosporella prunicola CBS 121167]|uniref:N-acetyltransferase domain-containing protein n=1 Tax=Aplosporella prunicola CBS 121167 TaxID=1176127 RepID=A0A6A6BKY7_9PEZI|nr:uncharacterized protein K452DRAFT_307272 [Aplosporella prunicola CBS 121167]KAF2143924.1 hypothetical protein K452DRAFT_307272 [Aplosporella prunicola CBS 121167]
MHLVLTRATRADIPEIVDLHYKTITGPLCEVLIGLDTEEGRRKAVQRWLQEMDRSSAHMWFKVLDSDTNRIVSVAHYMVYSNWVPLIPPQVNMDWLPKGEIRDAAEDITRQHIKQRAERLQGQPHILLNRLFTDPDYQKRGAGRMLVNWGCKLADRLFVPVFLIASSIGEPLYRSCGFKEVDRPLVRNHRYDFTGTVMHREAREPVELL